MEYDRRRNICDKCNGLIRSFEGRPPPQPNARQSQDMRHFNSHQMTASGAISSQGYPVQSRFNNNKSNAFAQVNSERTISEYLRSVGDDSRVGNAEYLERKTRRGSEEDRLFDSTKMPLRKNYENRDGLKQDSTIHRNRVNLSRVKNDRPNYRDTNIEDQATRGKSVRNSSMERLMIHSDNQISSKLKNVRTTNKDL